MSAQHKYINTMCMVSAKIQSVVCEIMYLSHTTTCSALCNTVLNSCKEDLLIKSQDSNRCWKERVQIAVYSGVG